MAAYVAWLLTLAAHEFGHALMAWLFGRRVLLIELRTDGGKCHYSPADTTWRNSAIWWGGVLGQFVLCGFALWLGRWHDSSPYATAALIVFVPVNIFFALGNLWPVAYGRTDGVEAWRFFPRAGRTLLDHLRIKLALPVRVMGLPPLQDEATLAEYLSRTAALQPYLKAIGLDRRAILRPIKTLTPSERGSLAGMLKLARGIRALERAGQPPRLNRDGKVWLFGFLLRNGLPSIREAWDRAGLNRAALIFQIAHGRSEAEFTTPNDDGGKFEVEIVNDDFTPMDYVTRILETQFGVQPDRAKDIMLKIHYKDSARLPCGSWSEAMAKANTINNDARGNYLPLLAKVAKVTSAVEKP